MNSVELVEARWGTLQLRFKQLGLTSPQVALLNHCIGQYADACAEVALDAAADDALEEQRLDDRASAEADEFTRRYDS